MAKINGFLSLQGWKLYCNRKLPRGRTLLCMSARTSCVHPRPVRPCQKPGSLICKHLCLKHHQRTHQTLFILKPNHPGSRPDSWSLRNVQFTPVVCCLKETIQDGFFYCSALKMTKCQPLKEISELFLPKKRLKRKNLKYPNCSCPIVGTVQILVFFLVKIYQRLTLRS